MAVFREQKKSTENTESRKKTASELLGDAIKLHKDGKLVEAEAFYLQTIASGFHCEIACSNLGVIYKATNRTKEARDIYKKAILFNPRFADAHANLGNLLKEEGQLDQALASTLKSLDLKPDNPYVHMNLGLIYKDLGQLDQALASTLKSLDLKPNNPDSLANLGGIYKELGQLDQALASTLKSLELKPNNPDWLTNLGGIYIELGQLDQALASTLKSLELKPDYPDSLTNLCVTYKELGQLDQALAAMRKSLELKPDNPSAHINLSSIFFDKNKYKDAEKEIDLAIEQNVSRLDMDVSYRLKAACLFRKKYYDEAANLLKELLANNVYTAKSTWQTQIALNAIAYAKKNAGMSDKKFSSPPSSMEEKSKNFLHIIKNRVVTEDLLLELQDIKSGKLSETRVNDARNGDGLCTNFELFKSNLPAIKQLSEDLSAIASKVLSKDIATLKYDSFFNVFKSGAGAMPHTHIAPQDKTFNLWQHKYSLVYYLDPGDQNCKNPGVLKMYDPDIQVLPKKGMIVIMPATRMHSSYYDGSKRRLMIGVNFYAFPRICAEYLSI